MLDKKTYKKTFSCVPAFVSVVVCSSTEVSFTAAVVEVLCVFKMVKTTVNTREHTNNASVATLSDEAASIVAAIKLQYDDLKGEIVSLKILLSY